MFFSRACVLLVCLCNAVVSEADVLASSCAIDVCSQPKPEAAQLALLQSKQVKTKSAQEHSSFLQPSAFGNASQNQPATGASAPLTEAGYQIVAAQCCNYEMSEFIRRVVFDQGMKVCDAGALQGFTLWYSCTYGPSTLAKMKDELVANMALACAWVALSGKECKATPDSCKQPAADVVSDCGCSKSESFDVDYKRSTLTQNNLGGLGPDSGAQEIRYTNVGKVKEGSVADLVITAGTGYKSSAPQTNGKSGGGNGKFGTINVLGGTSVEVTFSFMLTGTNTLIELGEVSFSVLDVDQSFSGKMLERVYASDYRAFVIDKSGADIDIERVPDGRTLFMSKMHGNGCDNPKDPNTLGDVTCTYDDGEKTIDQRKRAFMLNFKKVSSFKVTLLVTCVHPVTGNTDCKSGRNFLFAGNSFLDERCAA